ncbi:MAG: mechanosensitive ion channel family protein [Parasporobacterium sp.]|nr:mechanosensitive ion channel family protein [Parasporobacterium sp.]
MESFVKSLNMEDTFSRLGKYLQTSNFWLSLAILVVAVILWQVIKRVKKKWKERNGNLTTTSNVVFDIIRFLFFFLLIVVLLQINGVNVTALITGLGVVSVIVGLALQDFLKDIIMGVHILSDKFFQVGDVVRYNGMEGVVISFNVRTTKLKLVNYNEILTISNRNITEIMVMTDMFDLDIGLPYFVDSEKIHETMEVLTERIRKISGITNAMYKGTERFNESSVTYRIRYWTPPDGRRFDIRRAALRIVQDGLKEAGIPFPYNHLDVELVGSAGSAGSAGKDLVN